MPPPTPSSSKVSPKILCQSITSKELEGSLDLFLQKYHDNGHNREFGVLLVQSLPTSKARKSGNPSSSTRPPLSLATFSAKSNRPGIHVLEAKRAEGSIDWVSQSESNAGPGEIVLQNFLDEIESGRDLGVQCPSLKSTTQGLRRTLNIRTFPVSSPDKNFRKVCTTSGALHLCSSYITIATSASPSTIRTSLACLTTIYFHHRGSPRHWIVIPPIGKVAFEDRVAHEFKVSTPDSPCSQFVQHLGIWINPEILRLWAIPYFFVTQQPNQLLFLFPDAYYFGFSSGFSIIESKFHAGTQWNYQDYIFCNLEKPLCLKAHDGVLIQFPQEMPDGCPRQDEAGLASPSRSYKRLRTTSPRPNPRCYISPYDNPSQPVLSPSRPSLGSSHPCPPSLPHQSSGHEEPTDHRGNISPFEISDDDDGPDAANCHPSDDLRISRLQQENLALLRDIKILKAERDLASSRKAIYKARLLEREAYIRDFETRIKGAVVGSLREVVQSVEQRILDTEAAPGQLNQ